MFDIIILVLHINLNFIHLTPFEIQSHQSMKTNFIQNRFFFFSLYILTGIHDEQESHTKAIDNDCCSHNDAFGL